VAVPITEGAVDDGAQIELGADESFKHQSTINAMGSEGNLVNLESMGMLWQIHRGVDDRAQLDGYLVGLNGLERPGDKHIFAFGAAELDMATTECNK
jgi:hypothetical protein